MHVIVHVWSWTVAHCQRSQGVCECFSKHQISVGEVSLHFQLELYFFYCRAAPSGPGRPHYRDFTITFRHTTLGRTPLDEWSVRCRDLYLTTHNTYKRQTSMPPAGFEHAIPASKRPQTHALDRATTGVGMQLNILGFLSVPTDKNLNGWGQHVFWAVPRKLFVDMYESFVVLVRGNHYWKLSKHFRYTLFIIYNTYDTEKDQASKV
jgi:hypothetical protein